MAASAVFAISLAPVGGGLFFMDEAAPFRPDLVCKGSGEIYFPTDPGSGETGVKNGLSKGNAFFKVAGVDDQGFVLLPFFLNGVNEFKCGCTVENAIKVDIDILILVPGGELKFCFHQASCSIGQIMDLFVGRL